MADIKREMNADLCTGCSSCVVCCPVSEATSKFLGPKLAGPAFERFRLSELPDTEWLSYCSNCKNCDITCPRGVFVSLLNMAARGEYCKTRRPPLRDWVLSHGEAMARLAGAFPHFLVKFAMTNRLSRNILDVMGIDKRAPMPVFAPEFFPSIFKKREKLTSSKKAVLFPGCFVNIYDPSSGLDFVEILEKGGYQVILPEGLVCCGLPMIANGFMDGAAENAVKNYGILKKYAAEGVPVIALCPTCALMLACEYGEMFPEIVSDGPLTVEDACAFVGGLMDKGELKTGKKPFSEGGVIYHAPCHLRAAGNGLPGYNLLRSVAGEGVKNASAGCCGISGSYGFKKGKYGISMDIGRKLFEAVKKSGAAEAASECGTCRVQITHGTGVKALHPVSIIKKYIV